MSVLAHARRLAAALLALVAVSLPPAPAAAQTQGSSLEGVLDVVWADPHPGAAAGRTRFRLALADGRRLALDMAPEIRTTALQFAGRPVVVRGRSAEAAGGRATVAVEAIEADARAPAATRTAPVTRRVLFVLLRYKGDTQQPHDAAFYTALTEPKVANTALGIPATINGYYDRVAWGRLQWTADVVGATGRGSAGWLTLPGTKAHYADCGWDGDCADSDAIAADALAMVEKLGIDLTAYDDIGFVLNNDMDCCALGGTYTHRGRTYGATWEPPWGQETGVYIHEFGHAIGLPHSGWVYFAYDSPWDDMSEGTASKKVACGSYRSANSAGAATPLVCTEPGSGFIAMHKQWMGWLPAADIAVVDTVSTRTVALEADALPLGAAKKMIRICLPGRACTGSKARYLTVEARTRTALYSKGLPGDGVILHDVRMDRPPIGGTDECFFNDESGWAVTIDATPGDWRGAPNCDAGGRSKPNYALYNAQLGVGKVWRDTVLGVKVEVLAKTATGYSVRVTRSK